MSQLLVRLFEKWAKAGGDHTFSEWLDYRRECAKQERARQASPSALTPHISAMRDILMQRQMARRQSY